MCDLYNFFSLETKINIGKYQFHVVLKVLIVYNLKIINK